MPSKYPTLQIFLHWLSLLFVLITYFSIQAQDLDLTLDWYDLMVNTHYTFGICVWGIIFVRLIVRHLYLKQTPAITPTPPVWQTKLAHYVHLALYLFFILIPIFGALTVLNKGSDLTFANYPIIAGFNPNPETAHTLKEIHETLVNIAMALVVLHAIAALFHHYIVKDNTLLRMMPHKSK
ncbi:cytochrome b [Gallibacterium sp. AGMB14963]|uniref:cytochrome b n=1 Tax=Gallibacterium faecale TaxID=3019086 RepID=UPI0022F152C5|nr:cytochrome b [Gallibacterium sp. AGMB14963]MDA3977633.1 cytochrome b [Gallibacterium sp. AGMB14963]